MAAKAEITVSEAGRRGAVSTRKGHGPEFYQSIGKKGAQKVKQLVAAGRCAQQE